MIAERIIDASLDGRDELGLQSDGAVVLDDGIFDGVEWKVPRLATVVLSSTAEEVEVVLSASADSALHDHAAVAHAALNAAFAAPETALEVVRIEALSFARTSGRLQHRLDLVEHCAVDQGGVSPFVPFALIDDFAEVVAVAEEAGHFRR
ncbi:hypothetical protein NH287_01260 [Microbacterium sp. CnD16-F]|uniref:hypothetical protein n=1 Tax=Microbacterium sp. CnD16-F TaxID=2954493 RepID=UPI00209734FA|nr:hypothetical protein [Microbacterium sp. CnD16-F]MCO7202145.1 hypothetical protein [Microbacterium sp. CnD16-F]